MNVGDLQIDMRRLLESGTLKTMTKALLVSSTPFFCFFAFGITEFGQGILTGNIAPGTDHWKLDDIYMGAGLAPWAYGLLPFLLLCGGGIVSWFLEPHKTSN